jgi:hypothetical protein
MKKDEPTEITSIDRAGHGEFEKSQFHSTNFLHIDDVKLMDEFPFPRPILNR